MPDRSCPRRCDARETMRYSDRRRRVGRARAERHLNPGGGRVSRLCHEPRVALAVLEAMLAPHVSAGRVTLLTRHRPIGAETDGDRIRAVRFRDLEDGDDFTVEAPMVLDTTELGDLLPLARVE